MGQLDKATLLKCLKTPKNYKNVNPFLDAVLQCRTEGLAQIISQVLLQLIKNPKVDAMGKLHALRFYKDMIVIGNPLFLDEIDEKVEQEILRAAVFNPKFKEADGKSRGDNYFTQILGIKEEKMVKQLSNSFVLLSTQIIEFCAQIFPNDFQTGEQSRFSQYSEELKKIGIPMGDRKYFKEEQAKDYKKNFKKWKKNYKKLEKSERIEKKKENSYSVQTSKHQSQHKSNEESQKTKIQCQANNNSNNHKEAFKEEKEAVPEKIREISQMLEEKTQILQKRNQQIKALKCQLQQKAIEYQKEKEEDMKRISESQKNSEELTKKLKQKDCLLAQFDKKQETFRKNYSQISFSQLKKKEQQISDVLKQKSNLVHENEQLKKVIISEQKQRKKIANILLQKENKLSDLLIQLEKQKSKSVLCEDKLLVENQRLKKSLQTVMKQNRQLKNLQKAQNNQQKSKRSINIKELQNFQGETKLISKAKRINENSEANFILNENKKQERSEKSIIQKLRPANSMIDKGNFLNKTVSSHSMMKTQNWKYRNKHVKSSSSQNKENMKDGNLIISKNYQFFSAHKKHFENIKSSILINFPFVPEYFDPIKIENSEHFRSCCFRADRRDIPFFSDQLLRLFIHQEDSYDHILTISNEQNNEIKVQIEVEQKFLTIEGRNNRRITKKGKQEFKLYGELRNLNFRFPILKIRIQKSGKRISYRLPIPITLFSFCSFPQPISQKLAAWESFNQNSKIKGCKMESFLLNEKRRSLSDNFPYLPFLSRNEGLQFNGIITYKYLPKVRLRICMKQQGSICSLELYFDSSNKVHEAFAKVLLQVVTFLLI